MHKVFDLIGVEQKEADAMREALHKAGISFYETPKANWGRGSPGIWVSNEASVGKAINIIRKAQQDWLESTDKRKPDYPRLNFRDWRILLFVVIILTVVGRLLWRPIPTL